MLYGDGWVGTLNKETIVGLATWLAKGEGSRQIFNQLRDFVCLQVLLGNDLVIPGALGGRLCISHDASSVVYVPNPSVVCLLRCSLARACSPDRRKNAECCAT